MMPKDTFFNLHKDKQERIMHAIIKEMGLHAYEHININNIIKDANIPRGSFYQYFSGKDDMFGYFYTYIAEKKFAYWGNLLTHEIDLPFIERFEKIYERGLQFTKDYPELVLVGKKLLGSDYLNQTPQARKSMELAIQVYAGFIKKDQALGRIRDDVDAEFLGMLILELTSKMTLDDIYGDKIDEHKIKHHVNQLVNILKKGI